MKSCSNWIKFVSL